MVRKGSRSRSRKKANFLINDDWKNAKISCPSCVGKDRYAGEEWAILCFSVLYAVLVLYAISHHLQVHSSDPTFSKIAAADVRGDFSSPYVSLFIISFILGIATLYATILCHSAGKSLLSR